MVVGEPSIHNIMGGMESTGGVRLHNHRRKLKQRFDIVKKLGQGTYGKVQLGINKETGQEVAIKTIKKAKIETDADLIRIRREIQIMSSVQHPNIIHIYEVFENREKMVLVMEYAAGGELYDYLSERKVLIEEEARRIFRQIATAVYYCHKHKICHRDLKLENILLDENGNAKIADFGLSNVFDEQRLLTTFCGSPLYASPEIVKGTPYHGPEVDCWSLGVLLYTLVYGAMPFDGSNFKRLVKQISQGDYFEPKKPSPASPLVRDMLTVNPAKRANVEQICCHWWVNEGYCDSCFEIAEELANQTPVRLDLLLSLVPPPVGSDQLLVPNKEQDGEDAPTVPTEDAGAVGLPVADGTNTADVFARSHSIGSIMELEKPQKDKLVKAYADEKSKKKTEKDVAHKRKLEECASGETTSKRKEVERKLSKKEKEGTPEDKNHRRGRSTERRQRGSSKTRATSDSGDIQTRSSYRDDSMDVDASFADESDLSELACIPNLPCDSIGQVEEASSEVKNESASENTNKMVVDNKCTVETVKPKTSEESGPVKERKKSVKVKKKPEQVPKPVEADSGVKVEAPSDASGESQSPSVTTDTVSKDVPKTTSSVSDSAVEKSDVSDKSVLSKEDVKTVTESAKSENLPVSNEKSNELASQCVSSEGVMNEAVAMPEIKKVRKKSIKATASKEAKPPSLADKSSEAVKDVAMETSSSELPKPQLNDVSSDATKKASSTSSTTESPVSESLPSIPTDSANDVDKKKSDDGSVTAIKKTVRKSRADLPKGSSAEKSGSSTPDAASPTRPEMVRRKSKIFQQAERFNNILGSKSQDIKSPPSEKPKKVIIAGLKVSDFKKNFEAKPAEKKPVVIPGLKVSDAKRAFEQSALKKSESKGPSLSRKNSATESETNVTQEVLPKVEDASVKTVKSKSVTENQEKTNEVKTSGSVDKGASIVPSQKQSSKSESAVGQNKVAVSNEKKETLEDKRKKDDTEKEAEKLKMVPALKPSDKPVSQEEAKIKKLKEPVKEYNKVKDVKIDTQVKNESVSSPEPLSPQTPTSPSDAGYTKVKVKVGPNEVKSATMRVSSPEAVTSFCYPEPRTEQPKTESPTSILNDKIGALSVAQDTSNTPGTETVFLQNANNRNDQMPPKPAKKKSAVEIVLNTTAQPGSQKSATLPRRTSKAEIQMEKAYSQASPQYKSEVETPVGMDDRVPAKAKTQRSEVAFPVSAAPNDIPLQRPYGFRSLSVEPEPSRKVEPPQKMRHHHTEKIIPIAAVREDSVPSVPPPYQRPPQSMSGLQRGSSLSRQSTQDSDTDSTISTGEPIKKSPREYIIPIAVEGGGYITPRETSVEPKEDPFRSDARLRSGRFSRPKRFNSRLSDGGTSEDEGSMFGSLPRHSSLNRADSENTEEDAGRSMHMHRLRSSRPSRRPLEHSDSFSSAEEDDDDGFEILTAESLFSTLLSRVRSLTQRLNIDDGVGPQGMLPSRVLGQLHNQPGFPTGPGFWTNLYGRQGEQFPSRQGNDRSSQASREENATPWRRSASRDGSDTDSIYSESAGSTNTMPRGSSYTTRASGVDQDGDSDTASEFSTNSFSYFTPSLSRRMQRLYSTRIPTRELNEHMPSSLTGVSLDGSSVTDNELSSDRRNYSRTYSNRELGSGGTNRTSRYNRSQTSDLSENNNEGRDVNQPAAENDAETGRRLGLYGTIRRGRHNLRDADAVWSLLGQRPRSIFDVGMSSDTQPFSGMPAWRSSVSSSHRRDSSVPAVLNRNRPYSNNNSSDNKVGDGSNKQGSDDAYINYNYNSYPTVDSSNVNNRQESLTGRRVSNLPRLRDLRPHTIVGSVSGDYSHLRKNSGAHPQGVVPNNTVLDRYLTNGTTTNNNAQEQYGYNDESTDNEGNDKKARRVSRFLRPDFYETPREESVYAKEKDAQKTAQKEVEKKRKEDKMKERLIKSLERKMEKEKLLQEMKAANTAASRIERTVNSLQEAATSNNKDGDPSRESVLLKRAVSASSCNQNNSVGDSTNGANTTSKSLGNKVNSVLGRFKKFEETNNVESKPSVLSRFRRAQSVYSRTSSDGVLDGQDHNKGKDDSASLTTDNKSDVLKQGSHKSVSDLNLSQSVDYKNSVPNKATSKKIVKEVSKSPATVKEDVKIIADNSGKKSDGNADVATSIPRKGSIKKKVPKPGTNKDVPGNDTLTSEKSEKEPAIRPRSLELNKRGSNKVGDTLKSLSSNVVNSLPPAVPAAVVNSNYTPTEDRSFASSGQDDDLVDEVKFARVKRIDALDAEALDDSLMSDSYDSWSVCSDSLDREGLGNDDESVGDRIRRKSFYTRINDLTRRRSKSKKSSSKDRLGVHSYMPQDTADGINYSTSAGSLPPRSPVRSLPQRSFSSQSEQDDSSYSYSRQSSGATIEDDDLLTNGTADDSVTGLPPAHHQRPTSLSVANNERRKSDVNLDRKPSIASSAAAKLSKSLRSLARGSTAKKEEASSRTQHNADVLPAARRQTAQLESLLSDISNLSTANDAAHTHHHHHHHNPQHRHSLVPPESSSVAPRTHTRYGVFSPSETLAATTSPRSSARNLSSSCSYGSLSKRPFLPTPPPISPLPPYVPRSPLSVRHHGPFATLKSLLRS